MTAPNPRANPLFLGHPAAEATLLDALRAGRMHHAWLLAGPEGIGKATLAFRFARRLLTGIPATDTLDIDANSPLFRRVASGSHADLLTIERTFNEKTKRQRRDIVVDDVRRINGFMSLTPAEGGWRVAIVDGAEDLNQAAANALLKVLEEPPPRAILILVCSAPGRLLPTIRSRCRRLRMGALDDATMQQLVAAYLPDLDDTERMRLVTLAEGSIGRAILLAEEEGLQVAALVDELLASMPDVPPLRGYELADKLVRGDTGFTTFMDLLRTGIAAAVREVARGRGDPEQERLVALRPLDAWGEVWHSLTRLQDETERFALDKRAAIVSSLSLLTGKMQ